MRKKKFLFVAIGLALSLTSLTTSCSLEEPSNNTKDEITGIDFICQRTLEVGESTTVSVDILGSDDDSAIFTSLNPDIATISETGIITGISIGTATIRISAKNDQSFVKEFTIEITGKIPSNIQITIEKQSGEYILEGNKATIDLGSRLKFGISFGSDKYRNPDSVVYSFNNLNSLPSSASSLELDRNSGEFFANVPVSGVVLEVNAYYGISDQNRKTATLILDIVDRNNENEAKLNEIFNSTLENESKSFKETKVTRTTNDKINNSVSIFTSEYHSFIDSNYVISNDGTSNSYVFSGLYDNYDYAFDYEIDNNKANILQFYVNELHQESNNSNLVFSNEGGFNYGISSLIKTRFFTSSELIDGKFYGFGNYEVKASSKYSFDEGQVIVSSSFIDEERGATGELKFTLNYNEETKVISSYKFEENVKNLAESPLNFEYSFVEASENFVYGEKDMVNKEASYYFDFDDFYFSDLTVSSRFGAYDENDQNLRKFGYDKYDPETKTYTLSYDRTLIIDLNSSNKYASSMIDHIVAVSSNSESIPNPVQGSDGSFSISAKTDQNGSNFKAGTATFTFTTSKGYEDTIKVQFTEAGISDVFINDGTYNTSIDYVETTFEGKCSANFYINNGPSDVIDGVTYSIKVVSATNGNLNGISLYKYDSNNIDGLYGYAIKGNEVGIYEFRVVLHKGSTVVESSRLYKIEVKEPYSVDYIKEHIVGKKFILYSGICNFMVEFIDETTLSLTENDGNTQKVDNISYHIEKGNIVIDSDVIFKNVGYFVAIKEGALKFANDFSSIKLYLEYSYTDALGNKVEPEGNYRPVAFKEYHDIRKDNLNEIIKSKTFKANGGPEINWGNGVVNPEFTLSFADDNSGKITVVDSSNTLCEIKFTYEISGSNNYFYINILSKEPITLDEDYVKGFKYDTIDYLPSINGVEGTYYFLEVNLNIVKKYGAFSQEERKIVDFPIFG